MGAPSLPDNQACVTNSTLTITGIVEVLPHAYQSSAEYEKYVIFTVNQKAGSPNYDQKKRKSAQLKLPHSILLYHSGQLNITIYRA